MESGALIFAYGSNMYTPRIRSRVSTATPVTVGHVRRRKLVFHKRSVDGSAKADALFTARPSDQVWGVIYQLKQNQKSLLDRFESLGVGYDREIVDVNTDTSSVRAWMYVARREAIDTSLHPYTWYHDFIIHGARQHQLPADYIEYLRNFESRDDPDDERHVANRRLLEK